MTIHESAENYLKQILILLEKKDNLISLTDKGYVIAKKINDRHRMLIRFLIQLGVPEKIAREDACKIEHDLSDESYAAICRQIRKDEGVLLNGTV